MTASIFMDSGLVRQEPRAGCPRMDSTATVHVLLKTLFCFPRSNPSLT